MWKSVALITTIFCLGCGPGAPAPEVDRTPGKFEVWESGIPHGWSYNQMSAVNRVSGEDGYAAEMSARAALTRTDPVSAVGGDRYRLSARAKGSGSNPVLFVFVIWYAARGYIISDDVMYAGQFRTWTPYQMELVAPMGAEHVVVRLEAPRADAVTVDDVNFIAL